MFVHRSSFCTYIATSHTSLFALQERPFPNEALGSRVPACFSICARDHSMMAPLPLRLSLILIFSFITTAQAAPALPSSTNVTSIKSFTSNPSSPPWSKEAIFTLAGVVIAVAGVLITLVLSSRRIREALCCPHKCQCPQVSQLPY